jgi:hypothetical protein
VTHRLLLHQMQDLMIPLQETRLSSSGSSTRTLNVTMFPSLMINSGAQLGVIGTVSHVGLSFILAPSSGHECLDDVMLFMYLIDVASVSQLCFLPFIIIYITWDVVKIA